LFLENLVLLVQPIMDMFDSHGFAEGKHNWKPMGFVNPGVFCMFFLNNHFLGKQIEVEFPLNHL
jgi:hypothetical protein